MTSTKALWGRGLNKSPRIIRLLTQRPTSFSPCSVLLFLAVFPFRTLVFLPVSGEPSVARGLCKRTLSFCYASQWLCFQCPRSWIFLLLGSLPLVSAFSIFTSVGILLAAFLYTIAMLDYQRVNTPLISKHRWFPLYILIKTTYNLLLCFGSAVVLSNYSGTITFSTYNMVLSHSIKLFYLLKGPRQECMYNHEHVPP